MAPRVRDDLPHAVRTVESEWITLPDGTRLAARLWLPEGIGPVPAILEYLPYRLSDGTQAGDHQQMGWFAGHGYACARVDIRGTGNSGGVIEDEYSEQEQLDGLEVIAWLAAQPWCDGRVGIVGTSWSGFNGLQLAAR
ncbi:MAG TPA: CocE/NonD family hydrolase, partial [Gaiellales bacterium]|nr:CocE/NonD family hydrolase [Gaiellales bacterium]